MRSWSDPSAAGLPNMGGSASRSDDSRRTCGHASAATHSRPSIGLQASGFKHRASSNRQAISSNRQAISSNRQ
eukprot:4029304-Prymnesium_polylepis.1